MSEEAFVWQIDLTLLTWDEFVAVMDVYRRWTDAVWHIPGGRFGVRFVNVPIVAIPGIYETVARAPQGGVLEAHIEDAEEIQDVGNQAT